MSEQYVKLAPVTNSVSNIHILVFDGKVWNKLENTKETSPTSGRMARGGHGLLKVSPGPSMPYPFLNGRQSAAIFYPFEHLTPYAYEAQLQFF
jgi:hypothetical protein